jgi:hypothetical protein
LIGNAFLFLHFYIDIEVLPDQTTLLQRYFFSDSPGTSKQLNLISRQSFFTSLSRERGLRKRQRFAEAIFAAKMRL